MFEEGTGREAGGGREDEGEQMTELKNGRRQRE